MYISFLRIACIARDESLGPRSGDSSLHKPPSPPCPRRGPASQDTPPCPQPRRPRQTGSCDRDRDRDRDRNGCVVVVPATRQTSPHPPLPPTPQLY